MGGEHQGKGRWILPAVGATAAAVAWWLGADRLATLLLLGTLVQAVASVLAPQATHTFNRKLTDIVRIALQAALGALAWAILVLPAWVVTRIIRLDQLRDGSGWKAPDGAAVNRAAHRPFALDAPASFRRRLHGLAAIALASLVVVAALWAVRDRIPYRSEDAAAPATIPAKTEAIPVAPPVDIGSTDFDEAALDGQPHAGEMIRDLGETPLQFDPAFGYREAEVDHEWVKVKDRERASYTPDDPVRRVWVFGGSAAFGIGQRDEFTIPSELAKLSEDAETPVEFDNYGVSAFIVSQESQLLAYLLATRPHPDLIVVYDGFNDSNLAMQRINQGDPHIGDPVQMLSDQIEDRLNLDELEQIQQPPPRLNTYGTDEQAVVDLGTDQYRAGAEAIRLLAKGAGIPVVFAWQPSLASLAPMPPEGQAMVERFYEDETGRAFAERVPAAIRAAAIPDSIDLSGALDGVTAPVYLDYVHTNEDGAHQIAAELWPSVRAALGISR